MDFKRLSLNNSPVPAGQFRAEAPLVRSTVAAPGGWQTEFVRQRSGAGTPIAQGKQAVREPQQMMQSNMFANQPSMMMNSYNYPQQQQQQQPMYQAGAYNMVGQEQYSETTDGQQQHAQMSDVDYEAAFAEAMAHAQEMDQQQQPPQEATWQSSATMMDQTQAPRIGSDAIQYREQSERTADQDRHDADELARTAGLLLNSVQHDTSSKFQNSQFLDLMRRIRDREVEVANNDLQTVGGSGQSATQETLEREMNNLEQANGQRNRQRLQEMNDGANRQRAVNEQEQVQAQNPDLTSHFQFPDMDAVYEPDRTTMMHDEFDENSIAAAAARLRSPYTTYGFDDDQYPEPAMQPQSQIDALHPGGKWYPEQSPRLNRVEMETEMSGAIPSGQADGDDGARLERMISASDFDHVDESAGLARRFVRGGEMGA